MKHWVIHVDGMAFSAHRPAVKAGDIDSMEFGGQPKVIAGTRNLRAYLERLMSRVESINPAEIVIRRID